MTAKEQKFLSLFAAAARIELPAGGEELKKVMAALIAHDYASAVLVWEYLLAERDADMNKDAALASLLTDGIGNVFEAKAAPRMLRLLSDSAAVREAVYRRSPTALSRPETIGYAAQMLLSPRETESEDILAKAMKNASGNFGAFMAAVVDRLIVELTRKNGKPSFSKKLAARVLVFSEKIKGPEKAFIAQRIREL